MAPDPTPPFDPETKPPLFEDAIESRAAGTTGDPNHNAFPSETTRSGTEIAVDEGLDVGAEEPTARIDATDPDDRTDLEGPDVLPEDDGTMTHPSFGAGVPLHLGMGTGAGEESVDTSAPLYAPEGDDAGSGIADRRDDGDDSRGLGYVPDANGN